MAIPADELTGLPGQLDELVGRLRGIGFAITNDGPVGNGRQDAGFNRIVELSDPTRQVGQRVRLVQDRGLWETSVEIAGAWHDPYEIVMAIDGAEYSQRAQSHADRSRFTLQALERLPTSPQDLGQLLARLNDYRDAYWQGLGVDPDEAKRPPALRRIEMAFRRYEGDHDIDRLHSSVLANLSAMEGDVPKRIRLHLQQLEGQLERVRFTTSGRRQRAQVDELLGRARTAIRGS
jgi:hypothetical protein